MTREELIVTARTLRQPGGQAASEFEQKMGHIAEELSRNLKERDDLERLIGEGNAAMMEDNSRNFCRFMSSMFQQFQPETLVDTALWVFRAYRSHGFHLAFWPANIDTCAEIVRATLSPETTREVLPFYDWLVVNIPSFTLLSDEAPGVQGRP